MNSAEMIRNAASRMSAAGVEDARVDAALLLSHLTGKPALQLRLGMQLQLSDEKKMLYERMIAARCERQPLQYLIGDQPFCGRSFYVDERVLIPRPETELLAELAVAGLRGVKTASPRALDLCCGSGCLAITMALEVPAAIVDAADLSDGALAVTRMNAQRLQAHIHTAQGDLWQAVPDACYDVIVSNPPYIPSSDCIGLQAEVLREPSMALDGGRDGLDFYRRIAQGVREHLRPGGMLCLEVGIGQAGSVAGLLRQAGLQEILVHNDLNGIERMVTARTPELLQQ